MRDYQLGFISSDAIFEHVQNTVRQYRKTIDLKAFNHNIIDPIKLTFDAKIYGQSIRQTIESECIRQIDKTNNDTLGIYAEVKNKHNTMNSASASATYLKMLDKIMRSGNQARCYLVEAIAKQSQDMMWEPTIVQNGHKEKYSWPSIRKISMDRFYGVVFGDNHAFFKLCKALPLILDDVIAADHTATLHNSVYDELDKTNFYRSLYLLAFQTYEGFEHF